MRLRGQRADSHCQVQVEAAVGSAQTALVAMRLSYLFRYTRGCSSESTELSL